MMLFDRHDALRSLLRDRLYATICILTLALNPAAALRED